ncbi:hypothetical protein LU631_01215 [Erwinia tracheiphila]|uniref:hypothetical protein n=1 Tax=Erwinia tracheiphila TaxID=65700 RepID=UPI000698FCA0|nr:hypothetical protein [Erwinia tracheiphila]UIA88125.1 hypothetical protein LU631_01215 [Erwinia tracheiphila]UIA96718.1 hypothetical protein LU633_01215 [Erwinia tracheiphila]
MDVCISLTDTVKKRRLWQRFQKKQKIADALLNDIIPKITPTLSGQNLPINYPWCFVMPANKDGFCFGALLPVVSHREMKTVFALHIHISYSVLCENMKSNLHLAFWLSRILHSYQKEHIVTGTRTDLREWVKTLERSFSPFWEKLLINEQFRFRNRSELLLSFEGKDEGKITCDSGVDIMPWTNWPGCIRTEGKIWLWRQSRYGRIIDSQTILL